MKIKAYITTELFDRDGKLLWRRRRKSKSFVKAFLALLLAHFDPATSQAGIVDTLGVTVTIVEYAISFNTTAAATVATNGIVVGTGSTPVTASDSKLATQIAHGVTSGKLYYGAVSWGALSVSDPYVSFTLWRDFTNSSGATITVLEEGIYVFGYTTEPASRNFCAIRDVEPTGVAVADGQNLRVTYTIQTST